MMRTNRMKGEDGLGIEHAGIKTKETKEAVIGMLAVATMMMKTMMKMMSMMRTMMNMKITAGEGAVVTVNQIVVRAEALAE